nr:methyltransferase, TIGR04325 family [Ancylobacter sp. Lp-2]
MIKLALTQTSLGRLIGKVPFVSEIYMKKIWSKRMNLFYGLHDNVDSAEDWSAKFSSAGWNDGALAKLLVDRDDVGRGDGGGSMQASQFAVLLWLSKLLKPDMTILDLGGAGGVFYEISKHHNLLTDSQHWHVVDMPRMVELGRKRHAKLKSTGISFGTKLGAAPASDIMLALGCIQYMRDPLGQSGPGFLDELEKAPDYVIVNKIPVWNKPDAWTSQGFITTACPYRIFNRNRLEDYFGARGYTIASSWHVPELDLRVPFHPECSLDHFEGFLATRDAREASAVATPLPASRRRKRHLA